MRIGFLAEADVGRLEWAQRNGFGCIQWNRFDTSGAAPGHDDWRQFAERFAGEAWARNIRISAIGALYQNPLDPTQSDYARDLFLRAIAVASLIGVKTVSGFAGAVIETEPNPRGGNPVYKPFEDYLPRLIQFWEPIRKVAVDKGVRIAFENCPMGPYHLPIMGFNMLAQPTPKMPS